MDIKIYLKQGRPNYIERKYIDALKPIIEKKIADNPELANSFKPASSIDELKRMYELYTSNEATIIEETINNNSTDSRNNNQSTQQENIESMSEEQNDVKGKTNDELISDAEIESETPNSDDNYIEKNVIDPFNREEPLVRDYVLGDNPLAENTIPIDKNRSNFDEPVSFGEAFEFPDNSFTEESTNSSSSSSDSENNHANNQSRNAQSSFSQNERINPDFDEMSNKRKQKSTRKFAKYIIETVCLLQEKGFVWYANLDTNDAKLAEYELSGELDLSLIITLDANQNMTIKQFFQRQNRLAEKAAVISEEDKIEWADCLAEVLLERGLAPTPTQELIMISVKILMGQGINLLKIKSETSSVLNQLREMKKQELIEEEETGSYEDVTNYRTPEPRPSQPSQSESSYNDQSPISSKADFDESIRLLEEADPIIETKE